jgi:hypothetical protein
MTGSDGARDRDGDTGAVPASDDGLTRVLHAPDLVVIILAHLTFLFSYLTYPKLKNLLDASKLTSILAVVNWLPTPTSPDVSVASLGFSTHRPKGDLSCAHD